MCQCTINLNKLAHNAQCTNNNNREKQKNKNKNKNKREKERAEDTSKDNERKYGRY